MSSSGSASSTIPCAAATALPSSTSARDELAQVRPLAHPAVREARQRADRVRRRVEDHLAPLGRAPVGDRGGRHPARVQASASARSRRPGRRLAPRTGRRWCLPSRPTARRRARAACPPGRSCRGSRARRAARSSPRCRRRSSRTPRHRRRTRARSRRVRHRRASPSWRRCRSRRREAAAASVVACGYAVTLSRADQLQSVLFDSVDMRFVQIERPHLDIVERGQVRGEQRARRPRSPTTRSSCRLLPAVARDASESSRPPVIPDGRRRG